MEKGDKIIWDSGFGYEVGYFIEDGDKKMSNTYVIELITGVEKGITHRSKDETTQYTLENANKMKAKYNYDKTFE